MSAEKARSPLPAAEVKSLIQERTKDPDELPPPAASWAPTLGEMVVALGSRLLTSLEVRMQGGVLIHPEATELGERAAGCSVHHPSSDSALSGPGTPPQSSVSRCRCLLQALLSLRCPAIPARSSSLCVRC